MRWLGWRQRRREESNETLVVYTAIFGVIPDRLRSPAKHKTDPRVRYVCFTDRADAVGEVRPWMTRPAVWTHADPRRTARYHKILSHIVFPQADYTVWLDGNLRLVVDPWKIVRNHLAGGVDIAVFRHRHRNCLYEELDACIRLDKDAVDLMTNQVSRYRARGYPPERGLGETGIVARRQNSAIQAFNDAWWREIENGSLRDQLSFNFVSWSLGQPYAVLKGRQDRSPYVQFFRHR